MREPLDAVGLDDLNGAGALGHNDDLSFRERRCNQHIGFPLPL